MVLLVPFNDELQGSAVFSCFKYVKIIKENIFVTKCSILLESRHTTEEILFIQPVLVTVP